MSRGWHPRYRYSKQSCMPSNAGGTIGRCHGLRWKCLASEEGGAFIAGNSQSLQWKNGERALYLTSTSQVCTRGLRCGSRQWRQRELHTFHGSACGVLLRLTCSTRRRHHTKCIRRKRRRRISVSLHLNFCTSCPFQLIIV